jgi:hypothetical protein
MLYEGGIRVPLIVRWPGYVEPGAVTDHVSAFWDYMPTLAEIAGAAVPPGIDGLSMVAALTGDTAAQASHEWLYWEYNGGQAVLSDRWKAVRAGPEVALELYDLVADPAESMDVVAVHPDVVERLTTVLELSRTPSAFFPLDRAAAARLGRVRRACGLVAAATREVMLAVPETVADPGGPGSPDPSCTVNLRSDVVNESAGGELSEAIRSAFRESRWGEDISAAADGAGTTAFAYRREGVRCAISAGQPASLVDGEIVVDKHVYLEAGCYAED